MSRLRLSTIMLLSLVFVAPCIARVSETFYVESNTWDASQIVAVLETGNPGEFRVIETWKGDLKPQETIRVPEMATFQKESLRRVFTFDQKKGFQPTGQKLSTHRLILFLKKPQSNAASPQSTGKKNYLSFQDFVPVADDGGMKVSFAWVSSSEVFAFSQIYIPGSGALMRLGQSEKQLNELVASILKEQRQLTATTAIADKVERARSLVPLLFSEYGMARDGALDELAKCGREGLPIYREVLNDPMSLHFHDDMVKMMADSAGVEVGPELYSRLQEEVAYWRKRAPNLKMGWWSDTELPDRKSLQDHYMVVFGIFQAFEKIRYQPCVPAVKEFLALWRSSPNLDDKSGLDQIIDEGVRLLKGLGADQH